MAEPLVLLSAGGTGGHLFPAEALAVALKARGVAIELATDHRATQYGAEFPARETHIIPSSPMQGRDPIALARTFGRATMDSKLKASSGSSRPSSRK